MAQQQTSQPLQSDAATSDEAVSAANGSARSRVLTCTARILHGISGHGVVREHIIHSDLVDRIRDDTQKILAHDIARIWVEIRVTRA